MTKFTKPTVEQLAKQYSTGHKNQKEIEDAFISGWIAANVNITSDAIDFMNWAIKEYKKLDHQLESTTTELYNRYKNKT